MATSEAISRWSTEGCSWCIDARRPATSPIDQGHVRAD